MSGPFVLSPNSAFLLLQRMCCYSGVKKTRVAEISESLCDSGHQWLRRGGQPNGDNRHRNVCECCVWAGFEVLESRSDLSYRCAAALDIPSELASIKSIFFQNTGISRLMFSWLTFTPLTQHKKCWT
jgi:hypothetical protein